MRFMVLSFAIEISIISITLYENVCRPLRVMVAVLTVRYRLGANTHHMLLYGHTLSGSDNMKELMLQKIVAEPLFRRPEAPVGGLGMAPGAQMTPS